MAHEIFVPKLGLTETHATIVRWVRKAGDRVSAGEVVAEVEADKADVEIESPADGVIAEILILEGASVELGSPIALLATDGDELAASQEWTSPTTRLHDDVPTMADPTSASPPPPAPKSTVRRDGDGEIRVLSSPLARRVAAELGVDINSLIGTGPGGLVVERDARSAAAAGERASTDGSDPPVLGGVDSLREIELSRSRRAAARRLASSAAIPTVTLHRYSDLEQARLAIGLARAAGASATFTHVIMAACARVLPQVPELNGFWVDDHLYVSADINLGVAVDLPDGLGVVVVANCEDKTLYEIAAETRSRVEEARAGRNLNTPRSTFTISNLGMFGVEFFSPLLNPPETGILGVGAISDRRICLSLTFDHRAIDGAPAARFLSLLATELA